MNLLVGKKPKKLTESDIQDYLYRQFSASPYTMAIPSSTVLGWESDLVLVTKALVVHEFEIKLTRADFRADRKKGKFKHFEMWRSGIRKYPPAEKGWGDYQLTVLQPPNFLWYVCPRDVIPLEEVPEFAGLIYPEWDEKKYTKCTIVKKAPRIVQEKIDLKEILQLSRSMTFRYWNQRLGIRRQNEND